METRCDLTGTTHGRVCGACCTRLTQFSVYHGKTRSVEDINLHIHCGELTAVIGPNGAGKTTLFRAIIGDIPYTGEMKFVSHGEKEISPLIGYAPQHFNIPSDYPLTVLEFLCSETSNFPVWLSLKKKARQKAYEALANVSALQLAEKKLGELSGGELQRVLLASAMNPIPQILILDEPVSGVDVRGLSEFYNLICEMRRKYDISILIATHDLAGIARHADRMILLNKKIIADGKPADLLSKKITSEIMGNFTINIESLGKAGSDSHDI